ncbi:hypothetical protein N483_25200 [Pseudoalteromonas luteoviolacea NCIMB 1944]|nr:hypothetical protein N483_25200 [Pseudoalteromonas luteoviolacea NCIMB 1944]
MNVLTNQIAVILTNICYLGIQPYTFSILAIVAGSQGINTTYLQLVSMQFILLTF